MLLLLSFVAFVAVLALPAIPSLREIRTPRDDGRLAIPEQYVRDPRWFGRAFRSKILPVVEAAREPGPARAAVHLRVEEDVQWSPELLVPAAERTRGIVVGDRVVVGASAGIRDAYALDRLEVERDVVARTLTSDRALVVGEGVRVLRWIDSDGDLEVAEHADLGISASAGGRVTLSGDVRFERIWGAPVAVASAAGEPLAPEPGTATIVDATMVASGKPIVIYGAARVGRDIHVPSHLKVHGAVTLEPGASVGGNLIARGNVSAEADAAIGGNVFAEGTIRLGPGTRVGRAGAAKTVYATGAVELHDRAEIFGWVISEQGGRTA